MQDRADGTNVNNWHWTEKDVSGWARHRLGQLLGGLALFSDESGSATTTTVEAVTGAHCTFTPVRSHSEHLQRCFAR